MLVECAGCGFVFQRSRPACPRCTLVPSEQEQEDTMPKTTQAESTVADPKAPLVYVGVELSEQDRAAVDAELDKAAEPGRGDAKAETKAPPAKKAAASVGKKS